MKLMSPSEVAQMASEDIIDRFYWGVPEKKEAEKMRKSAEAALLRRSLNDKYLVTVFATATARLKVIHIVAMEPRNENECAD